MGLNQVKINCFRCKCPVDESSAVQVKTITNEKKYECLSCNKKNKTPIWGLKDEEVAVKRNLYCAQCKYKFVSKSTRCPYCNKSENVSRADISVKDLL